MKLPPDVVAPLTTTSPVSFRWSSTERTGASEVDVMRATMTSCTSSGRKNHVLRQLSSLLIGFSYRIATDANVPSDAPPTKVWVPVLRVILHTSGVAP